MRKQIKARPIQRSINSNERRQVSEGKTLKPRIVKTEAKPDHVCGKTRKKLRPTQAQVRLGSGMKKTASYRETRVQLYVKESLAIRRKGEWQGLLLLIEIQFSHSGIDRRAHKRLSSA